MPRILDLVPMPDGRVGVALDVPPAASDSNGVSLWTDEERQKDNAAAARAEREAILDLVDLDREDTCLDWQWGEDRNSRIAQQVFKQIADAIRARR